MPQKDTKLLQDLVQKYAKLFMKMANNAGIPYDDAEDVVMESLWAFYNSEHYEKLDENSAKFMVMRIVKNKSIDYYRKNKKNAEMIAEDGEEAMMHLGADYTLEPEQQVITRPVKAAYTSSQELDKELKKIFERTYGTIQPRAFRSARAMRYDHPREVLRQLEPAKDYLLVDGYNIIFAWDDLNALAKENLDAARHALMDLLCNYQAYRHCELILVFDAYRVPGQAGLVDSYHNIHVVYTK